MRNLKSVLLLIATITLNVTGLSHPAVVLADDAAPVKIAVFDVDATPPLGSKMAYEPVLRLDELTLRCRGSRY